MSKNFEANKPETIQKIEDLLWESIEVLRGNLDSNEYFVVLYLLTLVNEGVLDETTSKSVKSARDIKNLVTNHLGKNELSLKLISDAYEPALEKIESLITKVIDGFLTVDSFILRKNFQEIFEFLFFKLSKANGKYIGEAVQPQEVTQFISAVADIPQNSIVYNPFAGYCSFRFALPEGTFYKAQEINTEIWALGYLRLIAYNNAIESYYLNEDSILHWGMPFDVPKINELDIPSELFKHDLVIASPPFNMRLPNRPEGRFGVISTIEHFFIEKGLDVLRENGKLIGVLPSGFLFRAGAEQELRKYLVENDLISTIISLPGGLLFHTAIPIIVFVIDKNKEHKGKIKFVNGSDFVVDTKQRNKVLDYKRLLQVMETSENSEYIRLVENKVVILDDYNLSVLRYFKQDFDGTELWNVLTRLRGIRYKSEEALYKVVRIKDLITEPYEFDLKLDYEVNNYKFTGAETLIQESCLLIASLGEKLKPSYFNYVDQPIVLHQNVMAFKIDDTQINKEYLIVELNSPLVAEQMRSLLIGSGILKLRVEDFLALKIELPSLEEQKAKIRGIVEVIVNKKQKEFLYYNQILGLEAEIKSQNAYLRHTLAGAASNITGSLREIKKILESSVYPVIPDLKDLKVSTAHTLTFGKYVEILERDIQKISHSTSSLIKTDSPLDDKEIYPVNLFEYLLHYYAEKSEANKDSFKLEYSFDKEGFMNENGLVLTYLISGNEELLTILFDNILTNAQQHAFKKSAAKRVEIFLMIDRNEENKRESLTILVSNTGKELPENFTLEDYVRNGSTAGENAGEGYGGYLINGIIKKLNGSFDIIDERGEGSSGSDLVTTFVITFPIIQFEEINETV